MSVFQINQASISLKVSSSTATFKYGHTWFK